MFQYYEIKNVPFDLHISLILRELSLQKLTQNSGFMTPQQKEPLKYGFVSYKKTPCSLEVLFEV